MNSLLPSFKPVSLSVVSPIVEDYKHQWKVFMWAPLCLHARASDSGLSQIGTQYSKPLYKGHDLRSQCNSYNTF